MRRLIAAVLILIIFVNIIGCEAMAKKFRRKKKAKVMAPRIYQEKKYIKKPTPELYKKHYSYWSTWSSELISVMGNNKKKDSRCINEMISNLHDMQGMLITEKALILDRHIKRLEDIKKTIEHKDLSGHGKNSVRGILEKESMSIKREFVFKKVKDNFRLDFESE